METASGIVQYEFVVVNNKAEFDSRTASLGSGQAVVLVNGNEHVQVAFGDDLAGVIL